MSYFQDLSPEGKQALHAEFERDTTTDERRVEILTLVRDGANEAQMGPKCPRCGNYSFHAPWDHALIEGHVYSDDGAREIYITGYCEFCFDLITQEPEEEEQPSHPGDLDGTALTPMDFDLITEEPAEEEPGGE